MVGGGGESGRGGKASPRVSPRLPGLSLPFEEGGWGGDSEGAGSLRRRGGTRGGARAAPCTSGDAARRRGRAATGPGRPSPSPPPERGRGEGDGSWGRRSDGRAPGGAGSARCVRRLDGSLVPAIRITYRVSLRSSSSREPRYPSTGVVSGFRFSLRSRAVCAGGGGRGGERGGRWALPPSSPSPSRLISVALPPSRGREPPRRGKGARSGVLGAAPLPREGGGLPRFASGSRGARPPRRTNPGGFFSVLLFFVSMILPQVHLRKPCYDFSFL